MEENSMSKAGLVELELKQLGDAVARLSGNCFQTKRLCITVVVSSLALLKAIPQKDISCCRLAFASACVSAAFWLLDGHYYELQHRIRWAMHRLAVEKIPGYDGEGIGLPARELPSSRCALAREVLLDRSMLFYAFVVLATWLLLWLL